MGDDDSIAEDGDGDDDGEETFEQFYALQREASRHQLPDQYLQLLVAICNDSGVGFRVTLTIGGLVVTGVAISVTEFLADLGESARRSGGDAEAALAFGRMFSGEALAIEVDRIEDDTISPPLAIHLRDATIWQGGEILASGAAWRGRLAMIDGWILGEGRTVSNLEER